ncbi:transcriptional regulator, partial [Listeria monocytogenes]|nr:transcriptional regulator [Listeria monocytogenes]
QLIINAYIRESPKFQILETLLLASFPNLQALAKKVHVSYSGIKKEIKELNEELSERNLYISTGNQVEITGDEFSLRIFYAFLFLVAYSGDRWPFSFVRYDEITDLLESCPKEIYRANSIDKAMMIHYYVAMHLLRDRMNCQIDTTRQFKVALYKACTEESKKSESAFIKKVAKQLPNRNYKEMTYTTQIILSTIVAFGSYSSIEKMPSFFYMDEQLEEMGFMKLVDFASERVNDNLSIPFSEKEMELLRYSFASINYRYFLL